MSSEKKFLTIPYHPQLDNMNMEDAYRFCTAIGAKCAAPIHCGMFDNLDRNAFAYEPKIVPEIYKEFLL